jgi:SnoaL-like domain
MRLPDKTVQSKGGIVNQRSGSQDMETLAKIDHVYRAWDEALGNRNVDAAIALYAPDATIESPLVSYLLGSENGVCRGRDELRRFIETVFQRTPSVRKRYRTAYFTDGRT